MQTTLTVQGMTCGGCAKSVERAINELAGISSVAVDWRADQVVVSHDDTVSQADITGAIEDAGFEVV
ncbi:MAG: copper ion binding protein [Moraxella sp.]|uniref:heavy-metal-associated domain-containing protein n=1 Tax=Moraxella sp. TaxID=479 RepID=UPI0026DBEF7C|nr:copper ion binding protein [Moraxella sp.]MDO4450787.1 copper ion binding protein [Moraxella sp.]